MEDKCIIIPCNVNDKRNDYGTFDFKKGPIDHYYPIYGDLEPVVKRRFRYCRYCKLRKCKCFIG